VAPKVNEYSSKKYHLHHQRKQQWLSTDDRKYILDGEVEKRKMLIFVATINVT